MIRRQINIQIADLTAGVCWAFKAALVNTGVHLRGDVGAAWNLLPGGSRLSNRAPIGNTESRLHQSGCGREAAGAREEPVAVADVEVNQIRVGVLGTDLIPNNRNSPWTRAADG